MAVVWKKIAFSDDAPTPHEATHVSGGSDDIDSALADAAIPNLATSKITSGQFSLDRIPRGTDTHVLTAKGAGVSPAYEAPAGGDGQSLWLRPFSASIALGAYVGWMGLRLNANGENCHFVGIVPSDFTSLVTADVVIIGLIAGGVETFDWTIDTFFAAEGEGSSTHSGSTTADGERPAFDAEIMAIDVSAALTGLAAGDYLAAVFTMDVFTDTSAHVLGLHLRYS